MFVISLVAVLAILAGCAPEKAMTEDKMMEKDTVMETKDAMMQKDAMKKEGEMKGGWTKEEMAAMKKEGMMDDTHMMEKGLIGGDISKYYDWDRAKFDQAVKDGKTVYLEFSADWCGICQKQEPHLKAAFAELDNPNVVGFKIHYKDSKTTPEMEGLAKEYQVAYQHTKVILKNGKVVLKSPEAWEAMRFLKEMKKLG